MIEWLKDKGQPRFLSEKDRQLTYDTAPKAGHEPLQPHSPAWGGSWVVSCALLPGSALLMMLRQAADFLTLGCQKSSELPPSHQLTSWSRCG